MKQSETNLSPKISHNKYCSICHYSTSKTSDFNKHLLTVKHKKRENETNETEIPQKSLEQFQCLCGIHFNSRTTLWRHKKRCNVFNMTPNNITTELVMELIKDNKDMKKIILEQNFTINNLVQNGVTNNHSHNVNSMNNNKTFNLQFFLNETCKDAMNITDFVTNIKLELNDLENTGRRGYVEGISNIIVKNLNNMEQHLRP